MPARVKAESAFLSAGRRRLAARLGAFFAILLVLAAGAHPLRAPFPDHAAHHGHVHAERSAAPGDPDHRGPEHQGCHFCRLDGVALPPPQLVLVPPLRDFEVRRSELPEAPGAVPARLVRPYVRGPPRRA